jgi:ankyrin repeat protein
MTLDEIRDLLNEQRYDAFVNAIDAEPILAVSDAGLLIKAVNLGSFSSVQALVRNGADVNPISESPFAMGKSLLLMAIGFSEFDIAQYLLEHGANPYHGFHGTPDYGIFLAKYSRSGLLTKSAYDALIESIRNGIYPTPRSLP